ncbi:MAG: hypothetical protein Q8M09_08900 [Pseudomonadota bacterium]|nr:hypothetical protein [Pseudomonadota bacterium]MDP1904347.1 hypothetical protein [Pseudomonadota bacterium]MDP2353474.1 hypothetical protein [Pseudomonadota bacterium]
MSNAVTGLPDAVEQVRRMHAPFIHAVVGALRDRSQLPELMQTLVEAERQGWPRLAGALRQIIDGKRDATLKLGLDEEDRIIVETILLGLDNPASLPALEQKPDGRAAAPGLAAMIDASGRGDAKALAVLAEMAEQMVRAGGDMARLGGIMRRLVNGERDADALMKGMGPLGRQLTLDVLSELGKAGLQ